MSQENPFEFYHKFTLPSGRKVSVPDITNEDYLLLIKHADQDDIGIVYEVMNYFIKQRITDFDDLNVLEKLYVYLAFIYYSIRPQVSLASTLIGQQEVSLSVMLNNLEEAWQMNMPEQLECELNDNISVVFDAPKHFNSTDDPDIFVIDYLSGIKQLKDKRNDTVIDLTEEQKKELLESLSNNDVLLMEDALTVHFSLPIDYFKGVTGLNEEIVDVFSNASFQLIMALLKEPLDVFYEYAYVFIQYVRCSWSDFMKMTPIESQLLFTKFQVDKQKQREEQEKQMKESGPSMTGNMGDPRFDGLGLGG